jgi:4-cresol dehydrogenase (hydroxylating)
LIAAQAKAGFGQMMTDPGLGAAVATTFEQGGRSALHARVKKALDPNSIFASV